MDFKRRIRDNFYQLYGIFREFKWALLIISFIIVFCLGVWGFSLAFQNRPEQKTFTDLVYHSLQLFRMSSGAIVPVNNWQLEWARFLAIILTMASILLVLLIFIDYLRKFRLRYFTRHHVIICGLGYLGPKIADHFLQLRTSVVIIERDEKNPEVDLCRQKGAIVFFGDATKETVLEKAQIHKARHIFAVTGNDASNAEIAVKCHELTRDTLTNILTCHVHIVDSYLCNLLRNQIRSQSSSNQSHQFRWEFFNVYQIAGYCIQKLYPLFPEMKGEVPETNILIIGVGRMGKTLISRSVRKWRDIYGESGEKMTISLLDRNARTELRFLLHQFPSIEKYCDFQCIDMDLTSPDFIEGRYLKEFQDRKKISKIYLCIDDSSLALSAALTLHREIQNKEVCIIIRTPDVLGFAAIFRALKTTCGGLSNIFTFPIVSCECCRDFIIMETRDILGKVIHSYYVSQKISSGTDPAMDQAMKPWDELNESLKESNRLQGDDYIRKVHKIGCYISLSSDWEDQHFDFTNDEIEFLAEDEHDRWMRERLGAGWTYGGTKDIDRKISPFLKPYHELPEDIKDIDRESIRRIPEVLSRIDMKISRFPEVCQR